MFNKVFKQPVTGFCPALGEISLQRYLIFLTSIIILSFHQYWAPPQVVSICFPTELLNGVLVFKRALCLVFPCLLGMIAIMGTKFAEAYRFFQIQILQLSSYLHYFITMYNLGKLQLIRTYSGSQL
jgi:hypothetical protein